MNHRRYLGFDENQSLLTILLAILLNQTCSLKVGVARVIFMLAMWLSAPPTAMLGQADQTSRGFDSTNIIHVKPLTMKMFPTMRVNSKP